jgi:signal transduction histidine kinase
MDAVRERVRAYAHFISRVIYDMKWYAPPVQTVRGQLFQTDVNRLLRFLVENVFQRVATASGATSFVLDLDEHVPPVQVNEFVAWEAIEPIIQNGVEHAGVRDVRVFISTRYDPAANATTVSIEDNGVGVSPELLEKDDQGIRRIFLENVSTKTVSSRHSGYGCYIARQIAVERCRWECDVENLPEGGCRFFFVIPHSQNT